jgi:hypothetical protein
MSSRNINLKEINIRVIPQKEQRFGENGDYWWSKPGVLEVRISKEKNWVVTWLCLIHEIWEIGACLFRGITFKEIEKFDNEYKGEIPGFSIRAPYHREHMGAVEAEELFCEQIGYTGEDKIYNSKHKKGDN